MLLEGVTSIIFFITTFLFILVVGCELFSLMVREQIRYLNLIIFYAPLPTAIKIPFVPEPVSRYLSWAIGKNADPVSCARIRYTGKTRYGAKGQWMKTTGEAIFSGATPGFVWCAKTIYVPGIWIETFDYFIHRDAAVKHNLFSVLPLNNAHRSKIKTTSLFRYLASMPLFPMALTTSGSVTWEPVDDSTVKATIHDNDLSAKALFRFDGMGRIESIGMYQGYQGKSGSRIPGHYRQQYTGYTDMKGYQVPMQITSELMLPDGGYACEEYTITGIDYEFPKKNPDDSLILENPVILKKRGICVSEDTRN